MYMAHEGQFQHEEVPPAVVITQSVQVIKCSRHKIDSAALEDCCFDSTPSL